MRRGAVGIAADVGGFGVIVMAAETIAIFLGQRFHSVNVPVAIMGVSFDSDGANDAGMHRRFGHRHHAWLQRRHDKQDERKRGTKPRNTRKSMLTRVRHLTSFDTSSGAKSSCAIHLLFRETET